MNRKVPSRPIIATEMPAPAAPRIRIRFCVELKSAIALVIMLAGTMLGISDARAGWSNA